MALYIFTMSFQADVADKELHQQELNLRMFRKGQASALFERQVMVGVGQAEASAGTMAQTQTQTQAQTPKRAEPVCRSQHTQTMRSHLLVPVNKLRVPKPSSRSSSRTSSPVPGR